MPPPLVLAEMCGGRRGHGRRGSCLYEGECTKEIAHAWRVESLPCSLRLPCPLPPPQVLLQSPPIGSVPVYTPSPRSGTRGRCSRLVADRSYPYAVLLKPVSIRASLKYSNNYIDTNIFVKRRSRQRSAVAECSSFLRELPQAFGLLPSLLCKLAGVEVLPMGEGVQGGTETPARA